jgi:hypothetical protein
MIEFLEDTHTYLADGIIIPSVSELIRFNFPEAYANIPDRILKKKASYGTKVHQTIEAFLRKEFTLEDLKKKRIDPDIKIAVEQFESLRRKWMFEIKDMEQIVSWRNKYAGQFDLLTIDDYIIDIKTTTDLHEDWLALQLGLYYLASGIKKDFGYCMWVPKGKMAKVIKIPVVDEGKCVQLVGEYEKHTSGR